MKKYIGEEFLNKIYKDLHNSEIVMHSAQKSDNKNEKVERYLDRIENVTNRAFDINRKSSKNNIEYLKKLYYKKYVIKEEDIPESYFILQEKLAKERGMGNLHYTEDLKQKEKEIIIKEQEENLNTWIEYLASRDTEMYPTWFKYYVFQGMLKLGNYDKENGEYTKRTKHTIKPFIEINREALAMVYDSLYNFLQKEEISDNELKILLQSGNFGKLYSYFVKVLDSISKDNTNSDEGIWKKYNMGSNPEILYNDIHGKGTGWCTAGGIETAKTHIEGGDFYVYYTKDKEGNYTCPRIAIRKEYDEIAEIRGIASNQNLEPNMEKVVEEKLKGAEFPDREEYKKKVNDMQMMTYIYTKYQNKVELTKEELRFLYEIDNKIKGFGYGKDPRIEEIRDTRDVKKDLSIALGCSENQITFKMEEVLKGNSIYHYGNLDFISFTSAKGLHLPQYISSFLDLRNLISSEGLILPKYVGGSLYLNNLKSALGLILPEYVGADLELNNLINAKELIFPKYIGGYLDLSSLTNPEGLVLPKYIGGSLDLRNLTNAVGLKLPNKINGNLILRSIANPKGLILPEYIERNLSLINLSIYDKIVLPKIIGGNIRFREMDLKINGEVPRNEDGTLDLKVVLKDRENKVRKTK